MGIQPRGQQRTQRMVYAGGKVVFYEGILPYCQNDAGIAVVMGHEIAHAVAHHSNERMSQQALIQYGQAAATEILGHDQSDARKAILAAAIGMGTNVGITLPFSRKHEYEADHLGLIFMAMAGYDRMRLSLSGPVWQTHQQASSPNSYPLTLPTQNGLPN